MFTDGDALTKTLTKSQKVTLEQLQQWSKKLNIDVELKKTNSSSGAIPGAKVLLMNSDPLNLDKYS